MTKKLVIGIDIGGSHISCAAFDLIEKRVTENSFAESSLDKHAEASIIFSVWSNAIQKAIKKVGKENIAGGCRILVQWKRITMPILSEAFRLSPIGNMPMPMY